MGFLLVGFALIRLLEDWLVVGLIMLGFDTVPGASFRRLSLSLARQDLGPFESELTGSTVFGCL